MNQQKIGAFLKYLRKDKGLTQEQLAEYFFVSSRTVSRWETGSNMPDLGMLIELADFYDVDIHEIIDGERKGENMDSETKNALKKVAEYTEDQNKKLKKKMIDMMSGTVILMVFCFLLFATNAFNGNIPATSYHNIMVFTLALTITALALNIMYLAGILERISMWRKKTRITV